MRHLYPLAFFAAVIFASACSKDVLKSYDKRVLGTWTIHDVDRFGFNGADARPFKEGDTLVFDRDGALTVHRNGTTYQGSWDIERMRNSNDDEKKALHLTAINFTDQQVRSEYFNDMVFTGSNRFAAFINYNTRVYVYRFRRQ